MEYKELFSEKKQAVKRGCPNGGGACYCTGACNEIIGYWVDGKYEPVTDSYLLKNKACSSLVGLMSVVKEANSGIDELRKS